MEALLVIYLIGAFCYLLITSTQPADCQERQFMLALGVAAIWPVIFVYRLIRGNNT